MKRLAAPRFDYGVQFGGSYYYTPQEFQAGLRNQLVPEKQRAESALQVIDQMIALFENRVVDGLFEHEQSRRWQAWHDLTYGRLLAARVRYQVFAAFAANIGGVRLKSTSNGLTIRPVELPGSLIRETRIEDARRILTRCIESHPNTPWFHLARRELTDGFGLTIQERAVPRAVRTSSGRPTRTTQVSLPRL